MKLVLEIIDKLVSPIVYIAGIATLSMLVLTQIPSLNYIPKAFMLYILAPFVFGN